MAKRLRLFTHKVTSKTGQYHTSTKSYSRKLCLKTMLGMEPSLASIFVKCDGVTFEQAPSAASTGTYKQVWHFYSSGERLTRSPSTAASWDVSVSPYRHQDVEENG